MGHSMYVCLGVVCMYACTHVCMHVHMHVHMCVRMYVHIYVCMRVCNGKYIYYIYVRMDGWKYTPFCQTLQGGDYVRPCCPAQDSVASHPC